MRKCSLLSIFFLIAIIGCGKSNSGGSNNSNNQGGGTNPTDTIVGKVLSDWQEGYLDIHAINTGRGECTFFILPDGTTMLVDASSSLIADDYEYPPPPKKPNASISSGKAISNYIKHFLPKDNNKLNYILLSHFHPDHMGGYEGSLPLGPSGTFRKNGVTEVGAEIQFDKIIDRGYPDYDYPTNMKNSMVSNYIKFVQWAEGAYSATAEQFEVGSNSQFTLKNTPSVYSDFEIRNLAVNGKVWTGSGLEWKREFPEDLNELNAAAPDENIFSDVFMLTYGKFNYFTGGDIQFNGRTAAPWKDIEAPIAKVVSKVDVMKANHHGTSNTNSDGLLNKLKPNVVVVQPWRSVHPNPETINRFYNASPSAKIYLTNLDPTNRVTLGASTVAKFRSTSGHVVVRVKPGGDEYSVFVLDDNNEKYIVKQFNGPFKSE